MTTNNKGRAHPGATPNSHDHNGIVWEEVPKREASNCPLGGGVFMLRFSHDDWCPTLKTGKGGDCACNPDVKLWRMNGGRS